MIRHRKICRTVLVGAGFLLMASSLFAQETLRVGSATLNWKSPGSNTAPDLPVVEPSVTARADSTSTAKLQVLVNNPVGDSANPSYTQPRFTTQPNAVRLVRYESGSALPTLPAVSALGGDSIVNSILTEETPAPVSTPVPLPTAPIAAFDYQIAQAPVAEGNQRKTSFGKIVPISPSDKKTGQSLFSKDKTTQYQDVCPDPQTLPKVKDLSYKVVTDPGLYPEGCDLPHEFYNRTPPTPITFHWKASNLCHKPVYFEQVQLERYGHSVSPLLQPVISRVRFWLEIPVLPYQMGLTPPNECVYELGYYRPGSCAPHMLEPIPLSLRAGLLQAGATVGFIALVP